MTNKIKQAASYEAVIEAPFGGVGISVQGLQLTIDLLPGKQINKKAENKLAVQVADQISAYLKNPLDDFNLPIILKGTAFQRLVWQAISAIPCGQVLTYGSIAKQLDTNARAVANACGANRLPLVIPCHRVVAKDGLGGFMGSQAHGLEIKEWLLRHEGAVFQKIR